jgi:DNA helicase-2/ATP-dependent DNA helicase PcrA
VAITRAQKRLFFSYALTRYRFGRLKNCEPSRFLDDVDTNFIKLYTRSGGMESVPPPSQYAKNLVNGIKKNITSAPPQPKTIAYRAPQDFTPSDTSVLQTGMKVEHPKFGFGTVVNMDLSGADRKAKINFNEVGEKTLLLSFAKLRIIDN